MSNILMNNTCNSCSTETYNIPEDYQWSDNLATYSNTKQIVFEPRKWFAKLKESKLLRKIMYRRVEHE